MAAAGDLAVGIYFTGNENSVFGPPEAGSDAEIYQTKGLEYGIPEDLLFTGFASQGFAHVISGELFPFHNDDLPSLPGEHCGGCATGGSSADHDNVCA